MASGRPVGCSSHAGLIWAASATSGSGVDSRPPPIDAALCGFRGLRKRFVHSSAQCGEIHVVPVQERSTPPFEGFSERVTDGSDDDRTVAYGRWLKRLRQNQSDAEGEDASADQLADEEAR